MPRFPSVPFGRRKSNSDNLDNAAIAGPSFRVLDRAEVASGKSFDGGARLAARTSQYMPKTSVTDLDIEDNLFASLDTNCGSASSHTTKTNSIDNSSRHSSASTAPSSADLGGQEEWKTTNRRPAKEVVTSQVPKSYSAPSFIKAAGRSFSSGGQKKELPLQPPNYDPPPPPAPVHANSYSNSHPTAAAIPRGIVTTVTPPPPDSDSNIDLGGDFGNMFGHPHRANRTTPRDDCLGRQALAPRSLTGARLNQPPPIEIDLNTKIESSPYSWSSHHSQEGLGLLTESPLSTSPAKENAPPYPPRQRSPLTPKPLRQPITPNGKRMSAITPRRGSPLKDMDAEDERHLKDSLIAANMFLAGGAQATPSPNFRYRRDEIRSDAGWRQVSLESKVSSTDSSVSTENNMFEASPARTGLASGLLPPPQMANPSGNKVMTGAEFERYRRDRESRKFSAGSGKPEDKSDDEDHYEDDDDDAAERALQQAKQRRKQEAHMTIYRQQMTKVTGESSSNLSPSRPSLPTSFSTPVLPTNATTSSSPGTDGSDEDEEVPLGILAAHGFPNKNRPPARLSVMSSNPNLRASQQLSYQRPSSMVGDPAVAANTRLPAFARNLPQDPFLGAGLVHNPVRESFALGGGAPATTQTGTAVPPGGLVGVIANEERSRAMRRGSAHIDARKSMLASNPAMFDPVAGFPAHMMYPNGQPPSGSFAPNDTAQMQMAQQMQQMQEFMQMQMQFMQMMAAQGGENGGRPLSHYAAQSMTNLGDFGGLPAVGNVYGPNMARRSFVANDSMVDVRPTHGHVRSLSMVQPSSASWVQPPHVPPVPNYAPATLIQSVGYAPSIAPSERSNVGLPGRYRPVSQMPSMPRSSTSTMSVSSGWNDKQQANSIGKKPGSTSDDDDDDERGWQAMKAKKEKKLSIWKKKRSIAGDISALIH